MYLQLVNRLSQETLMGNESTFLPTLSDAFKNQSSYARKVVNPLPLCSTDFFCSTDVVFDKALSF